MYAVVQIAIKVMDYTLVSPVEKKSGCCTWPPMTNLVEYRTLMKVSMNGGLLILEEQWQ